MLEVSFASGVDEMTVQGLTQWDKGQQIQITCVDLPAVFQMHFACKRRTEAIVVSGTATDGVGTVTIPDSLLEQATELTAWVYIVGDGTGETIKTLHLPITARTKPEDYISTLSPTEQTQLDGMVAGVNAAIDDIEADVAALDTRIDTAESDISALDGRLDTAETTLTTHGGYITSIENVIDDTEHGNMALKTAITGAQNGIDSLNATVNNQTTGVSALNTRTSTLESAVNDESTGLSGLLALIGDIGERINSNYVLHDDVSINITAVNTPTSVDVSFGHTYTTAPHVVATPVSTVPGTQVLECSVSNITTTGCKIWLTRSSGTTATVVNWVAVGEY